LSGEEDVLVMSQFPGRPEAYMRAIGLFAQLCHLRTNLSGDPTCAEVVQRVRHTLLEAWQYEWVPSVVLSEVAELEGGRLSPLSATMNALPMRRSVLPRRHAHLLETRLAVSLYPFTSLDPRVARQRAWTDLYFYTFVDGNTMLNKLVYRADLFEADTVRRLTSGFVAVLETMLSNPASRLSTVSRVLAAH
jgi:non-ribosomal peptide synthetase component F